MTTDDRIILRGDFKKMDRGNKYIIIKLNNNHIDTEFMDASDDKDILSKISCEENSIDSEDLEQFSEYLASFKKPYDKLTVADFIKSLDKNEHNIKYIIEVNSERCIYKNKK